MPNPCPICTTQSAWGRPAHAPKHMENPDAKAAALWREVRPLLLTVFDHHDFTTPAQEALGLWMMNHIRDLEAE